MRSKEEAHDYRYFPEPDLTPVTITDAMLTRAREALPELPSARAERFAASGVPAEAARMLGFRTDLGDYYEAALIDGVDPVQLANWITNELVARLEADVDPAESLVTPAALASLVLLISDGKVTGGAARKVLDTLVAEGGDQAAIVEAEGLGAVGGEDTLSPIVAAALEANPDVAEKLRSGDMKPIGVIVGFVMRETKGAADGGEITKLVRQQLGL